jgi:cytochrome c-type biogenesis protein CcmE
MSAKKIQFMIAGVLIASSFSFLFLSSFQSKNMAYFLTVDEVSAKMRNLAGRGIRVEGKVVPNSLTKNRKAMKISFEIQGEKTRLPIHFTGVAPDLLENGFPVIAEGKLNADGVLMAKNLMVACPSKFEEMKNSGAKMPAMAKHKALIKASAKSLGSKK